MTSRDFCYWLQGYFELSHNTTLAEGINSQTSQQIRNHLAMVFKHEIDPSFGNKEVIEALQKIHNDETDKFKTSFTTSDFKINC